MTWAARLIEQHYDELFFLHGEGATIHRWLSALPEELVRSRPRLLLTQAFLALISGRLEAVEPLLDAAQQAYAGAAEEPFEPTVGRARSLLVNVPALITLQRSLLAQLRGDADATVAFASQAMAEADEGEWLLSLRPADTWPSVSGFVVSWPRLSAPSCPASPSGVQRACPH